MSKLYLIFKMRSFETGESINPSVYAYTRDKKHKKRFEFERDMRYFNIVTYEYSEKWDNELRNLKYKELGDIEVYDRDMSGFIIKKKVNKLLSTWSEQDFTNINTGEAYELLGKHVDFPINELKPKYRDALNILGYGSVRSFNLRNNEEEEYLYKNKYHDRDDREEYSVIELNEYNILRSYMHLKNSTEE